MPFSFLYHGLLFALLYVEDVVILTIFFRHCLSIASHISAMVLGFQLPLVSSNMGDYALL